MDVEAYFLASRRLTTPPPPTPASRRPRRPGWRSWRPPLWPGPLWRGRRQGDLGGALLTLPVLLGQGHALQSLLLPRLLLLDVALVASDVLGWPVPAAADLWPCPLTPSLPRSHRTSRRGFRLPHWSSLVVLLRPLAISIVPPPLHDLVGPPPPPPGRAGVVVPRSLTPQRHNVDFGILFLFLLVSASLERAKETVSLNRRI